MVFKKLKIEDICEVVSGGTPSTKVKSFWDGDIAWITPKDLSGYKLRFIAKGERDISEEGLRRSSAVLLPERAILLSTRAPIGYVAISANSLCTNQGFKNLICKPDIVNYRFLYYLLKFNREYLEANASGATYKELSANRLKKLLFSIPDIEIQNKISYILFKYDDLIENNLRRIELLEKSAELLYKEWFVNLRFPEYEKVEIKKGIPKRWGKKKLNSFATVIMGQSPSSKFYNTDNNGLPFHQGVKDFGPRFVTNTVYSSALLRIANPYDILFSVRAPVGRINITTDKIVIGRGLASIRSKFNCQSFLYYQLKNHFFKEDMIGAGAIYASVGKDELNNQEILTPSDDLIKQFQEIVIPKDKQIENLTKQNRLLTQARDLLLPKLINGEIEI